MNSMEPSVKQAEIPPSGTSQAASAPSTRLRSLDALRGFDMLWIVGGDVLARNLANYTQWGWLKWYSGQMYHAGFTGFTFYDLIFPLFLFLAGVAVPFSLGRRVEQGVPRFKLLRKVFVRAAILVLLGAAYNGQLLQWGPLESIRICSVLGFIGISYFLAACIYLYADTRHQIIWAVGILLGYWAVLAWLPVPGIGPGVHTPEGSVAGYLDRALLPWGINTANYDTQGILVHINGTVTALLGIFTGTFLRTSKFHKVKNALVLLAVGAACLGLAALWGNYLVLSKELWDGPFVVHCAGWSLLLLGLFYLIIDALGFWRWSFFFMVIGMNSITIYLGTRIVNFHHTSNFLFGGLVGKVDGPLRSVAGDLAYILTWWLVLLFLYRKKIFLRV